MLKIQASGRHLTETNSHQSALDRSRSVHAAYLDVTVVPADPEGPELVSADYLGSVHPSHVLRRRLV